MDRLVTFSNELLLYVGADPTHKVFGNELHQYLLAVFVFLLSTILFYIVQKSVLSILGRVAERTRTDLDDVFVRLVGSFKPPFYLFLSFWLTAQFLQVHGFADTVLNAILVLWVVYQAVHIVGILVEDVVFRHFAKDQDETTKSALRLLANLSRAIVWAIGILLILSNFGINVTSLIAGAGIAGIAIAFALQGILGDLFSSFSLYFDKPFKVGDFISMDDVMGTVRHIGVKTTRIHSLSGEEIVVSNQELTKSRIRNFGAMDERRVAFSFGIAYETPLEKIRELTHTLGTLISAIDGTRFDRAHFKEFGDSSLNFEVVYYIQTPDYTVYMDTQQTINLALMQECEAKGIVFAYPTRTMYMHSVS